MRIVEFIPAQQAQSIAKNVGQAQPQAQNAKPKDEKFEPFKSTSVRGNGPETEKLQKFLASRGFNVAVDGLWGPETEKAVKAFQQFNKLNPDGKVGPLTVKKIHDIMGVKGPVAGAPRVKNDARQEPEFKGAVADVADGLGIKVKDIMAIMKHESNYNPQAVNPDTNATGLIQFMPDTAIGLGTSIQDLYKMTGTEQMEYVKKYLKQAGAKPGDDIADLYMLTFMPAFAHSPDDVVLGKRGGGILMLPSGKSSGLSMDKIWSQNPVFAKSSGRDSFTVGDVKNRIRSIMTA